MNIICVYLPEDRHHQENIWVFSKHQSPLKFPEVSRESTMPLPVVWIVCMKQVTFMEIWSQTMFCLKASIPPDVPWGSNSQILVFLISLGSFKWNSCLLTIWLHGMKLVHASMVAWQRIPLALPRGSRYMANTNGTMLLTNVWICVPLLCWCMSCLNAGSQHSRRL